MALATSPTALADTLARELDWLTQIMQSRIQQYFGLDGAASAVDALPAPKLPPAAANAYARLVKQEKLGWPERMVLALALAPHLRPQALDLFFSRNSLYDRPYTEFGGRKAKGHAGFLPTGETALFLLAGADLDRRLPYQTSLWGDSPLVTARLVQLGPAEPNEPALSGALTVLPETLALLTGSAHFRPADIPGFPAQRITTSLIWNDLVLEADTLDQVQEIRLWLTHQHEITQEPHLRRHLKPGYRALFYGPPGTGKTLTACLLGQATGHEVYRVDLSMMVSKYIGETEQNLACVFDAAERHQSILLFDEADALFGRGTASTTDHQPQPSPEAAYLLRRIEDFAGLVILISNLRGNLDEAITRRFQALISFPLPGPAEREALWRQAFADAVQVAADVDFSALAEQYPLAGGAIANVLRHCALMSLRDGQPVSLAELTRGIKREIARAS